MPPSKPDPTPADLDDALLAAYVDGVGELTTAERRAVEARLPALGAEVEATRGLLAALRDLPGEGEEPRWTELAARIAAEVGDRVPRPWWRRILVPATAALALAACAAVLVHARAGSPGAPPDAAPMAVIVPAHLAPAAPASDDTVWLDGQAVELGALDPSALAELGGDRGDRVDRGDDADDDDVIAGALLPTPDLAWVDDLDAAGLAVADRWLVDRKGT